MAVDSEYIRRFAGVVEDTADPVLEACASAAVEWYRQADVPESLSGNPLYDFWVANLAAWMYDTRGDAQAQIPPAILGSVFGLRQIAESQGGERG